MEIEVNMKRAVSSILTAIRGPFKILLHWELLLVYAEPGGFSFTSIRRKEILLLTRQETDRLDAIDQADRLTEDAL